MILSKDLDSVELEKALKILEEQVFQRTGRHLSEAEKAVIKGAWDGKDYTEIASDYRYSMYYLQQKIGPPLWLMLSEVIGDGVKVKKVHLKEILLKFVKKYHIKLEASKLDTDFLVGNSKIYGELPKIKSFYGREQDVIYLKNQIKLFKQRCVYITGVGGIGKSLLAAKLVDEIVLEKSNIYDYLVWKKIERSSSLDELVTDLIQCFGLGTNSNCLKTKISFLSKQLSLHRCLVVLDGFENLLQARNLERKLEYEEFLSGITKEQDQSCTIITSQLHLKEFAYIYTNLPILYFKLEGLEESAAMQMLYEKGLGGDECKQLVEIYRKNPSELAAVVDKIYRFFGGNVKKFFEYRTTIISSQVMMMLHYQFGQNDFFTSLQRQILIYLAEQLVENSTPIAFPKIIDNLKNKIGVKLSISEVMRDMEVLEQRSLVEMSFDSSKKEVSYGLQPVVKKYILIDPLGLVYGTPNKAQISNYIQAGNIV